MRNLKHFHIIVYGIMSSDLDGTGTCTISHLRAHGNSGSVFIACKPETTN